MVTAMIAHAVTKFVPKLPSASVALLFLLPLITRKSVLSIRGSRRDAWGTPRALDTAALACPTGEKVLRLR